MPIIVKNGITYNVNPNVVGASGLEVTTPEIEITASEEPFKRKLLLEAIYHANGPTLKERIAANIRESNIASQYFSSTPVLVILLKEYIIG